MLTVDVTAIPAPVRASKVWTSVPSTWYSLTLSTLPTVSLNIRPQKCTSVGQCRGTHRKPMPELLIGALESAIEGPQLHARVRREDVRSTQHRHALAFAPVSIVRKHVPSRHTLMSLSHVPVTMRPSGTTATVHKEPRSLTACRERPRLESNEHASLSAARRCHGSDLVHEREFLKTRARASVGTSVRTTAASAASRAERPVANVQSLHSPRRRRRRTGCGDWRGTPQRLRVVSGPCQAPRRAAS